MVARAVAVLDKYYFKDECGLRLHDTMIYEKTGIAFASGRSLLDIVRHLNIALYYLRGDQKLLILLWINLTSG